MSSLGELFFTLGLDDKKFNDAIEAAKKKVAELSGDATIGVKLDIGDIGKQIQAELAKHQSSTTPISQKVKITFDLAGLKNLENDIQEAEKRLQKGLSANFVNQSEIDRARAFLESLKSAQRLERTIETELTQIQDRAGLQYGIKLGDDILAGLKERLLRGERPTELIVEGNSNAQKTIPMSVEIDKDGIAAVQAQLSKLGEPITAKVQVELDTEKLKYVESVLNKLSERGDTVSVSIPQDIEAPQSSVQELASLQGAFEELSKQLAKLNSETEKISSRTASKSNRVVVTEEADVKRQLAQLKRLEEGVRRWENVRANIARSKVDPNSENYQNAIALIDAYIAKLKEAQGLAGSFTDREMTAMLGQTLSGEVAKTKAYVKEQKDLENLRKANDKRDERDAINRIVKEQAQLQRLEEGILRIRNVVAKLNSFGVDTKSDAYERAMEILNKYTGKLLAARDNAGNFTKREMASMLGQNLSGKIAEAERLVAAQRKIEQSQKQTAKSAAQQEQEELRLAKLKLQVKKEEANVDKANSNAKKAELQKEKESVRLTKERVALRKKLGKTIGRTANWAAQFGDQLSNWVSFYTFENFVRNLYTIGGEFQKQQIALQNMLGDSDKGNAIFERMKDLAVRSPFTFSELSSYTKQMAAYGIEYENIYDTTKRLADISTGVGVDMGRLILAFGQVRSAAVLRGQELRQFTEAGIPLVDELAKKFTELEGKAVSAGEVFEKISKREVSFGMVKDILFDMTDPGSRFFETQERLAESLAGKWSNLKDAWDIMMAEIAEGNNGALKALASGMTWMIKNWAALAPLIAGVVVSLASYRSMLTLLIPLQAAFNGLANANKYVTIISLIVGVATTIAGYVSSIRSDLEIINQIATEAEKYKSKETDKRKTAERYLDILKKQADAEADKFALYEKQKKTFEELLELYPNAVKVANVELMTLEEIEATRKRIADESKQSILNSYDDKIDEVYQQYTDKRLNAERIAREAGLTIDAFPETKRELEELYSYYTRLLNFKEEYEQSLIDAAKKSPLADWQIKATEIIEKYPNIHALKRDTGNDIWAYFDFLEETFKDAKGKYDRVTSKEMKKPYKAIMDAVNAVNVGIGGLSFYHKEDNKNAKEQAKRDADAYLNALKERLKEIGSKWNLFKELMEATGDKQLALNLAQLGDTNFGNQLEHLRSEMSKELSKIGITESAESLLSMGFDDVAKIIKDENKLKQIKSIYDAYHQANRTLRTETVKDFAQIIKASRDFEAQIVEIDRKLNEDLAKLRAGADEGKLDRNSEAYKRAEKKLKDDAAKAKADVNFEKFKAGSDWVKVFDDLDRVATPTLTSMLDQMEGFVHQVKDSPEAMKEMLKAIRDMREELSERDPFGTFTRSLETLQNIQQVRKLMGNKDSYTFDRDSYGFKKGETATATSLNDLERSALSDFNIAIDGTSQAFENLQTILEPIVSLFSDGEGIVDGFLTAIGDAIKGASDMGSSLEGIMGLSVNKEGKTLGDALGIKNAGIWGAAAGAALGVISSIANAHDKKLDKAIQKSQLEVEKLGNKYKNLEKTLERQLGSATSAQTQQMIDSLKKQQMELQKQYRLEDQKKKTDQGKLEDYKQQIAELGDQIKFFYEDFANEQYGVDIKGWAGQIADALTDAFASGEDAAMAFDKTVSDILAGLVKEMVAMEVVMPAMDSLRDFMFKDGEGIFAMGSDGNASLTEKEAVLLHDKLSGLSDTIGTAQQIWDAINKASGGALEGVEDSANSLSKNIQGVTENTADLLASYLNAIRADVSINRTLFEQLVKDNVPKMNMLAEAQLQQLQMIVSNTSKNVALVGEIRDLVNKVVDKSNNKLRI